MKVLAFGWCHAQLAPNHAGTYPHQQSRWRRPLASDVRLPPACASPPRYGSICPRSPASFQSPHGTVARNDADQGPHVPWERPDRAWQRDWRLHNAGSPCTMDRPAGLASPCRLSNEYKGAVRPTSPVSGPAKRWRRAGLRLLPGGQAISPAGNPEKQSNRNDVHIM